MWQPLCTVLYLTYTTEKLQSSSVRQFQKACTIIERICISVLRNKFSWSFVYARLGCEVISVAQGYPSVFRQLPGMQIPPIYILGRATLYIFQYFISWYYHHEFFKLHPDPCLECCQSRAIFLHFSSRRGLWIQSAKVWFNSSLCLAHGRLNLETFFIHDAWLTLLLPIVYIRIREFPE